MRRLVLLVVALVTCAAGVAGLAYYEEQLHMNAWHKEIDRLQPGDDGRNGELDVEHYARIER